MTSVGIFLVAGGVILGIACCQACKAISDHFNFILNWRDDI